MLVVKRLYSVQLHLAARVCLAVVVLVCRDVVELLFAYLIVLTDLLRLLLLALFVLDGWDKVVHMIGFEVR